MLAISMLGFEDLEDFRKNIRFFCEKELKPLASFYDMWEKFPEDSYRKIAEKGILSLGIPEEYGGTGDFFRELVATEEIARVDQNLSIQMEIKSLFENTLIIHGNDRQKEILRDLARGSIIPAFAFTEPSGGTDVLGLKTEARKENGRYVINGMKMFITNAPIATHLIVFARTGERISAFLAKNEGKGIRIGPRIKTTGTRGALISSIRFENMELDEDSLIGIEGNGLKVFFDVMDRSRLVLSAGALGMMRRLYEESMRFSTERKSGNRQIYDYQYIQDHLVSMAMDIEISSLLIYNAALLLKNGKQSSMESAMAKLYSSEALKRNAIRAAEIMGGYGYISGTPVDLIYRDAHATSLGLGSSEAMKITIFNYLKKFSGKGSI
jgi:alkylation response protein AidB-like acyl-CoA dehydrogenase